MNELNVALVGCGFFGKQLALSFHKAGANLVGVTDINFQLANQLAEKYSTSAYIDVPTLIESTTPDLVIIATFNYAHMAPAMTALNYDCHVFIEVPFALEPQDCKQIMDLARSIKTYLSGIY